MSDYYGIITMIDHVTIAVSDLPRSKLFYERAFAPLRYRLAFGEDGRFWAFDIDDGLFEIQQSPTPPPLTRVHVALRVRSKADVDAFYHAALAAGAKDNGAPGPRQHYTPTYYAAFILDPDGHNIEAMIDEAA
jgi:catechol 2,3-dioxygenase-like lactoylglutathione lyase family enzyme